MSNETLPVTGLPTPASPVPVAPTTAEVQKEYNDMMQKVANNQQTLEDIRMLTSSKITDQLKVFLISQARSELNRVIKLTQFLDKLEDSFINQVDKSMLNNELTLRQYSDVITLITSLLARSNTIISSVLKDDSLMTILNTTIYTSDSGSCSSSTISQLKDPQSRERVRAVINAVLYKTQNLGMVNFQENDIIVNNSEEGDNDGE